MKNIPIKIIALVTLVIAVTASILLYLPTIVAPPTSVPTVNLHQQSLESGVNAFCEQRGEAFNDSLYRVVVDKLAMYKAELYVTEEEIDFQTKALVKNYLPIFIKYSNDKFKASVWRKSDHKAMLNRINNIRTLKVVFEETDTVNGSFNDSLNEIENIIQLYNNACETAKYKKFYSTKDAGTKIMYAEHYKTIAPLNNCQELVNDLSKVKNNIGESHYNQVAAKVDKLANYKQMKESAFYNLFKVISDLIDEYDAVCNMYVNYQPSDELSNEARKYYDEAGSYYKQKAKQEKEEKARQEKEEQEKFKPQPKPEININTNNSEWISMISPSYSYRAYQSTNYGQRNSTATMSFTIKGYESFSFYVRSDGEADKDYLLVGVDGKPTEKYYYSTTKGNPRSGTSIGSYTLVNLKDLQKDRKYTIYVVYKKNGRKNKGSDKGYVLIPYK
ncbi:MAG: hypothetical protein IJZ87_08770 [Bacteroidales bacterium]|nr:hypothetical protein [Bacteroidales bacterium]